MASVMMSLGFIVSCTRQNVFGFSINLHLPTHRLFTFKLLEIDCIVTDRPWMSVTQLCA